jgi:hypothetical protein
MVFTDTSNRFVYINLSKVLEIAFSDSDDKYTTMRVVYKPDKPELYYLTCASADYIRDQLFQIK